MQAHAKYHKRIYTRDGKQCGSSRTSRACR